jgi:ERCC4-type nuclease
MRDPDLTILVDTREQNPLDIRAYPTRRETLETGDYGLAGFSSLENPAFILERKSIPDLCASLGRERERFLREVERMRAFRFRGLVIEGEEEAIRADAYRSAIAPASVLSTLDALSVRAGLHVFWCGDAAGAARRVERLARLFARGIQKDFERLTLGAGLVAAKGG